MTEPTTAEDASPDDPNFELELRLLLDAIAAKYDYDFRGYAANSVRRRVRQAAAKFGCRSLSQLQHRILREPNVFAALLGHMTVQVSELFRDPEYFLALRTHVLPQLRKHPLLKVWVAGCSNGEELYSFAIMMREEGLFDRTLFYATDVAPEALSLAQKGVYPIERVKDYTRNYQRAGGRQSLADHYTAAYDGIAFDRSLRERVVFADHSLASDGAFAEVHLVSCRNVLIYFDKPLQDRALALFLQSLVPSGYLGLGMKETVRFSAYADAFAEVSPRVCIFQKAAP